MLGSSQFTRRVSTRAPPVLASRQRRSACDEKKPGAAAGERRACQNTTRSDTRPAELNSETARIRPGTQKDTALHAPAATPGYFQRRSALSVAMVSWTSLARASLSPGARWDCLTAWGRSAATSAALCGPLAASDPGCRLGACHSTIAGSPSVRPVAVRWPRGDDRSRKTL